MKAQRYVGSKSDCPSIYAECVNDEWTSFVQEVFEKCRYQWEQRVPIDEDGRRQLREICQRMLAYENHLLSFFREHLLMKLRGRDRDNRMLSAKWLGRIIYPDEEIISSLKSLENNDNKELRRAVKQALRPQK